jgi:hypothetical protein
MQSFDGNMLGTTINIKSLIRKTEVAALVFDPARMYNCIDGKIISGGSRG